MNQRDRAVAWACGGLLLAAALLLALDALLGLGLLGGLSAWFTTADIWRRIILAALAVGVIALAVLLIRAPGRAAKKEAPIVQRFGGDQGSVTIEAMEQMIRKQEADAKVERLMLEREAEEKIRRLTAERDAQLSRVAELESETRTLAERLAAPPEPEKLPEPKPETSAEPEAPAEPEPRAEQEAADPQETPRDTEPRPEEPEPQPDEDWEQPVAVRFSRRPAMKRRRRMRRIWERTRSAEPDHGGHTHG